MLNRRREKEMLSVLDEIKLWARTDDGPGWSEPEWGELMARAVAQQPAPAEPAGRPYLRPVFSAAVILLATLGGAFFLLRNNPPAVSPGDYRAGEMLPADPAQLVPPTELRSLRQPVSVDTPVFTWVSPGTGLKIIWFFNETMAVVSDSPGVVAAERPPVGAIDAKPAELQFTIQLVMGSGTAGVKDEEEPGNDPVIRELRTVLKYKTFTALDEAVVRTGKSERVLVVLGRSGEYGLFLQPNFVLEEKTETLPCQVRLRKIVPLPSSAGSARSMEPDLISASLGLNPSGKTVIGVSRSDGDKGLILIFLGRTIR
jgi:hypothetical protein